MSKSKTIHKEQLNVIYVFSKDNQVYLRKSSYTESPSNTTTSEKDWFPINFQWKSLIK